MAKSLKNEQSNGKKFQGRQPGEKRNRKIDLANSEPKKTKFFTEQKSESFNKPRYASPSASNNDKPAFDKPRFNDSRGDRTERFNKSDRGEKGNGINKPAANSGFKGPRTEGFKKFDKPQFGTDRGVRNDRGARPTNSLRPDREPRPDRGARPSYGNGPDRNNRPDRPNRFDRNDKTDRTDRPDRNNFRPDRNEKPRFGAPGEDKNQRGQGFQKPNFRDTPRGNTGGFTGGDAHGRPRFPGDKSERSKPISDGDPKSKFVTDRGPRADRTPRNDSEKRFGKPRFESGGNDRPRFNDKADRNESRERGAKREIEPFENKRRPISPVQDNTFQSAEKFNKPPKSGVGLSKFKPIGSEPLNKSASLNADSKNIERFEAPKKIISHGSNDSHKADRQDSDFAPVNKTFGLSKKDKEPTPKGFKGSKREFNRVSTNLEKSNDLKSGEIRLNRYIANSGICSRREADDLITQGLVYVNGNLITELGTKIQHHDTVKVENRKVIPEKPVYIIMNKPKGYITTTEDPEGRKTVMELIDLPGKERIYPIGRLDRNTTGVLLLTNDGEMTQKLIHPSFEIKKVYRATLDKKPTKEHMLKLVEGVELEDGFMAFEQCGFVEEGKENVLGIEIKSGRNRIVRRMFEHFEYEVTALDRVLLGEFDKVKLGRGKWRFLTEKEMKYVDRLKRTKPKAPKE